MNKEKIETQDIFVMCRKKNICVGHGDYMDQYVIEEGYPAFTSEEQIKKYAEKDLSCLQLVPVKLTMLVRF